MRVCKHMSIGSRVMIPNMEILEIKFPEVTPEMFPAVTSLVPKPHPAFCHLQYAQRKTLRSRLSQNMSFAMFLTPLCQCTSSFSLHL